MLYYNTRVKLASRPMGLPKLENFTSDTVELPALVKGQVLVKIDLISLDPAMRGWMNDLNSFLPPIGIDEVFRATIKAFADYIDNSNIRSTSVLAYV